MAQSNTYFGGRILIVDDEPANTILLQRMLARAGYTNVSRIEDSRQFFEVFESFQPDLILLDLLMPYLDGYTIMEQLRQRLDQNTYLPVMVLTADVTPQALQRALTAGASDFLTKPFDQTELLLRVKNLLQTRSLYLGLQQQLDGLENLNLQSQQAISVRDESLSTISHDIGQPLAAMRFATEILQEVAKDVDEKIRAEVTENLRRIDAASRQMAAMITEISDLARLQMGRELTLHRTRCDLITLAMGQAGLQTKAVSRRIKLEQAADSLVGNWDEVRLTRVLSNLLSNAVKFSPKGGDITIRLEAEEDTAKLSIRDQGLGIPAEDLAHVFDPFYRASNVVGRIDGTGVGLASARHIIEQHGGSIEVESDPGQGTTVTLRLPLA